MSDDTATVTITFSGAPDGALYPREFAPGETVTGDLAAVAVREGWAKRPKKGKTALDDAA